MGTFGATHWLIIAGIFVILFGAKRLPEVARGMGRSMRIFKSEMQEMHADSDAAAESAQSPEPSAGVTQLPVVSSPTGPRRSLSDSGLAAGNDH